MLLISFARFAPPVAAFLMAGSTPSIVDGARAASVTSDRAGVVPTADMHVARMAHTATTLRDGRVLIAGGFTTEANVARSAEAFDPATNSFTPTGAMTVARESHTAVKLNDGRVLITGGHQGRREQIRLYTSAEAYDPATGVFRRAGDMQVRRHKHDAVLLRDGRVLIAGSAVLLPSGEVLLAGGASQAETFDPRRRAFTAVSGADRMTGQFSAVALLRNGGVLITGGYGHDRGPQPSAWMFRP